MTESSGAGSSADLLARVEDEREARWRAGDHVPAEQYLAAHPELDDGELAVRLVYGEYLLRERAGETPRVEEFQRRFPALADRLGQQIALHQAFDPNRTNPSNETRPSDHNFRPPDVPGFELLDELGRGGMAVVWRARDERLGRTVALKFIKPGSLPDGADVTRFRAEAEAVARLRHEHIVQIFEVGEAAGLPYMALEYVPGGTLAARVRDEPLAPRAAAELVERLARAVEVAHRAGIVHRDLKPGNVLLAADGSPRVADFGLAKRTDAPDGNTHTGTLLGTPSYMAPEQAAGDAKGVGPAADVYALGGILYECLTGHRPFRGSTPFETLQQVCTCDPVPPSRLRLRMPADLEAVCLKCLEKAPARRYGSAAALADDLRRWLDGRPTAARPVGAAGRAWKLVRRNPVVSTAAAVTAAALLAGGVAAAWSQLDAERARTAEARADSELIAARAAGAAEEQKTASAKAVAKTEKAAGDRADYSRLLGRAERFWQGNAPALASEALDACPSHLRGWEWHYLRRQQQPDRLAFRAAWDGVHGLAASRDGKWLVTTSGDSQRPLDPGGVVLWDAETGEQVAQLRDVGGPRAATLVSAIGPLYAAAPTLHTSPIVSAALTPDGRTLLTATRRTDRAGMRGQNVAAFRSLDGEMLVWDLPSRRVRTAVPGAAGPLAVSADGTRAAACCQGRLARVWHIADGVWKEGSPLPAHDGGVSALALSPDGRHFAAAGMTVVSLDIGKVDNRPDFGVYDAATGGKLPFSPACPFAVQCLAFAPDGTAVAAGCLDGVVRQWELPSGRERALLRGHSDVVTAVAFSADGKWIATGSADQSVKVWNPADGHDLQTYRGHDRPVTAVAFRPSADGRERLASAGSDGVVRTWLPPLSAEYRELLGHAGPTGRVSFSPDRPVLASVSRTEAKVRLWDMDTGRPLGDPLTAHADRVAFGPHGLLATAGSNSADSPGEMLLWDTAARTVRHRLRGHTRVVTSLAFSRDGKWLASAGGQIFTGEPDGVRIWDTGTGAEVRAFQPSVGVVFSLAFSPDGTTLVCGGVGAVAAYDPTTGRERYVVSDPGRVAALAFSPDGTTLAGGDGEGFLTFRVAADGAARRRVRAHPSAVFSVAYHPDGRRLVTASFDALDRGTGEVRVWDAADGRDVLDLPGEVCAAFSADGRFLAAPARGNILGQTTAVRVWDGGPLRLESVLRGEGTPVFAVAGSPAAGVTATAGSADEVTLWDHARGPREPPRTLQGHSSHVHDLDLSPDGRRLATASADRAVRLWDVASGKELKAFAGHTAAVMRVRFDPSGGTRLVSASHDRTARVWDIDTGRELLKVDHPEGKIMDLALDAGGRRAAVCSQDAPARGVVRVFDVATGTTLRRIALPHPTGSVGWQGATLAAGDTKGLIHILDAESGEQRREWKAHDGVVWGLAFTRGGALVSGGTDRLAHAWEPSTGRHLGEFAGHLGMVRRVTPVAAGGFATASADGTVRFWGEPGVKP